MRRYDDRKLIAHQLAGAIDGLVSVGLGESPTLTTAEHLTLFAPRSSRAGKVPVYAGTGSNSDEAVELTREAEALAQTAFSSLPYYNKPSQEGLSYTSVKSEVTEKPIILLIPGAAASKSQLM